MQKFSVLLAAILFISVFDADAQRRLTTYESLLQRTDRPSSYVDHVLLPADDSSTQFTVIFRIDYDFLPFLRIRSDMTPPRSDAEYFAPLRMGLEVFEGTAPTGRRASNAPSVFREAWQDTLWVDTFEETKSRTDYTQGFIHTLLDEGVYHYELQLARAGSVREQSSSRRNFTVENYQESEKAEFILMSNLSVSGNQLNGTLLNYGNNVLYGQDYHLLIKLPAETAIETDEFTLNIHRLSSGSSDDGDIRHTETISTDQIIKLSSARAFKDDEEISLQAGLNDEGVRYAYVEIPNQEFENARYRFRLMTEGRDEPIGERTINSQWIDMPVSLYNLDVAIEMLKFIVDDSELRRINSGSTSERERKFREFWAQRDPTPDTEFNELMAEYYRRIDHAYENFSSLQTPGYETDQGRAYILYGAPDNIERRLPTNAPTREVWEYPNRTLIFEATTGFGDFRLVSES